MFHPEAPLAVRIALAIHVVAGTFALFVVPLVLAVRKGGTVHRRGGICFVYAMAVVATTALVCAPYFQSYFLLFIALFSGYLTFAGYRVVFRKRPAVQPAAPIDWFGAAVAVVAGLVLVAMAIFQHDRFRDFSIVLAVLGLICAGTGVRSILGFVRPSTARNAWLFKHFGMMLAAYIATVTAFSAVNLHFIQPIWVRWLWPTVVGTAFITWYNVKYRRALESGAPLRQLVAVRGSESAES